VHVGILPSAVVMLYFTVDCVKRKGWVDLGVLSVVVAIVTLFEVAWVVERCS